MIGLNLRHPKVMSLACFTCCELLFQSFSIVFGDSAGNFRHILGGICILFN